VGLDGLKSIDEVEYFDEYIQGLNLNNQALEKLLTDPSADNFKYYLSDELNQTDAKILERYKFFNGLEGNSPIITNSSTSFTPSATNLPDNEDLNRDNTLADLEEYYEYEIDLKPNQMEIGKNGGFFNRVPEDYEKLISEVIKGNQAFFVRDDEIMAAWKWIDSIRDAWTTTDQEMKTYVSGSNGPDFDK
jgi:cell surface protein SprA